MRLYCVEFKLHEAGAVAKIFTRARNKEAAYDKAVYELIPFRTGQAPYSAWVSMVVMDNGNRKTFNTFEGKPY